MHALIVCVYWKFSRCQFQVISDIALHTTFKRDHILE